MNTNRNAPAPFIPYNKVVRDAAAIIRCRVYSLHEKLKKTERKLLINRTLEDLKKTRETAQKLVDFVIEAIKRLEEYNKNTE